MYKCKFCNCDKRKKILKVKEMMFGFREVFDYSECDQCGSLQINEIPSDLKKYYPTNYLSFSLSKKNTIKNWLKNQRFKSSFNGKGLLGKLLNEIWWTPPIGRFLKIADVNTQDSILDFGSGQGELLDLLYQFGFRNLTGVDPFIEADKKLYDGLILKKGGLSDIENKFDLIMFNHSLEHVPFPQEVLLEANRHLNDGKLIMIRIPVVGGFVWRNYGTNWVQLDAPRHLCIPSVEGIKNLASISGLFLEKIIFESWEFQFWGSEQYKNDIPLYDERSLWIKSKKSIFTKKKIKDFKKLSVNLNNSNDGDMACFFLRKK